MAMYEPALKRHSPGYIVYLTAALLLLIFNGPAIAARATQDTSDGVQLMLDDVEDAVSQALSKREEAEHVTATVTNTRKSVLHKTSRQSRVEIDSLTHDAQRQSWSANLLIIRDGEVAKALPVSGRYQEERALPVLTKRLRHGDIIAKEHITMQYFPATRIRRATITDTETLLGRTPERTISKDRPIRMTELTTPTVLKQGATVNMRYRTPYMEISTIGEALEDGGKDELIKVRNIDSNKVIRARVISDQEVVAGPSATNR